jgi:hypothetical protein
VPRYTMSLSYPSASLETCFVLTRFRELILRLLSKCVYVYAVWKDYRLIILLFDNDRLKEEHSTLKSDGHSSELKHRTAEE